MYTAKASTMISIALRKGAYGVNLLSMRISNVDLLYSKAVTRKAL